MNHIRKHRAGSGVVERSAFLPSFFAQFGANLNNGRQAGARTVNLNNAASNANWNIGAANSLT